MNQTVLEYYLENTNEKELNESVGRVLGAASGIPGIRVADITKPMVGLGMGAGVALGAKNIDNRNRNMIDNLKDARKLCNDSQCVQTIDGKLNELNKRLSIKGRLATVAKTAAVSGAASTAFLSNPLTGIPYAGFVSGMILSTLAGIAMRKLVTYKDEKGYTDTVNKIRSLKAQAQTPEEKERIDKQLVKLQRNMIQWKQDIREKKVKEKEKINREKMKNQVKERLRSMGAEV